MKCKNYQPIEEFNEIKEDSNKRNAVVKENATTTYLPDCVEASENKKKNNN